MIADIIKEFMKPINKVFPALLALVFVSGLSYYLFSTYRPELLEQVQGVASKKSGNYLDTIPLPVDSTEVGRGTSDGLSQITASSSKTAQEVIKFFKSVLVSKGWRVKSENVDFNSIVFTRDQERIEINVLSSEDGGNTAFSISFFD